MILVGVLFRNMSIAGYSYSYGAGSCDFWLVKTDSNGNKQWDKTFGGTGYDTANSVQQTSDGGYIIAGNRLVKADSNGNEQWNKTIGGRYIQQTADSGYILAGNTRSYGAGKSDFWLVKTDSCGNEQWNKTFGGSGEDEAWSVQRTNDGGYIITGETKSYGAGYGDVWLIKTDSLGNKQWNKTFGGDKCDRGNSVQQASDGGYIIAGYTKSYGAGKEDVWLIKTDSLGNKQWDKTFGGSSYDKGWAVRQTSDGGYIITGYTWSYGAGKADVWLIKVKGEAVENQPPTASFTYTPPNPTVNQPITFNASNSTDPDGTITNYEWDFGDGNITNTTDPILTHSYICGGNYTVTLTVVDNVGATDTEIKNVIVNIKGDLDCDGEVTSADAVIALRMAVSGVHNEGADMNRDGRVTSLDALMILQAAAGAILL